MIVGEILLLPASFVKNLMLTINAMAEIAKIGLQINVAGRIFASSGI